MDFFLGGGNGLLYIIVILLFSFMSALTSSIMWSFLQSLVLYRLLVSPISFTGLTFEIVCWSSQGPDKFLSYAPDSAQFIRDSPQSTSVKMFISTTAV